MDGTINYPPCDLSIDPSACYAAFNTTAFFLGSIEFALIAIILNIMTFFWIKPRTRLKIFSIFILILLIIEWNLNGWHPFAKSLLAPAATMFIIYWIMMKRVSKKPRWAKSEVGPLP